MVSPHNVTTIYVSQKDGNDLETGFFPISDKRRNGPVRTLERALEYIRQIRFFGAKQPITIKILDDEYYLSRPLVIEGSIQNITVESDNNTLISGGIKINSFEKDIFNGVECFSAYVPEVAQKGIWFTDLYVNGCHADFTHYPENGTLRPLSVDDNNTALNTHSKWFIAEKKDIEKIKAFKNLNDCFISYNHYWIDEHTPIESYDIEESKIVCKYRSRFSVSSLKPASAMEYTIDNVAEAFKNPNEWYLDRGSSKVYYIPKDPTEAPESISAFAPICTKLFEVRGTPEQPARNVYIRGLELAYTKGDYCSRKILEDPDVTLDDMDGFASDPQSVAFADGSIEFEYAENCSIEQCSIHSTGIHGIRLKNGCKHIRICNNDMYDLGGGGISAGGKNDREQTSELTGDIFIYNNTIKSIGRRYLSACGILLCHSYNNTVSHNDIQDTYYTGISVGWVWGYADSISKNNIIEYNHIHDLGQGVLSDMGGIYLLGRQQGTIVRNNIIHDISSKHYGGWGIYTDEGSSYITVENNICYNISCNCYHQHFGNNNTVRNNIFVKSKYSPIRMTRAEMHTGIIFEKNIIVSDGNPIYIACSANVGSIHVFSSHFNLMNDIRDPNAVIIKIGSDSYTLERAQRELGLEDGGMVSDPLFADYENNDFTLTEASPAKRLGFKPIDTKHVGVQR